MNELIKINCDNAERPTVMGRELHEALGIKSNYTTWFNRMCDYGFVENTDYVTCFPNLENENQHGGQNKADHQMTIDMAKEICMIQRTETGRRCRQYFIELEKQWNSPEALMQRALKMADEKIKMLEAERLSIPISATQENELHDEIRIKAIDICGSGRVYIRIGIEVKIAISRCILQKFGVSRISELAVGDYGEALKTCRKFSPDAKLKSRIKACKAEIKEEIT